MNEAETRAEHTDPRPQSRRLGRRRGQPHLPRIPHYVREGVGELDREKLTPLLKLKYRNTIADAVADLGRPEEIGHLFAGFQKYLYQAVP